MGKLYVISFTLIITLLSCNKKENFEIQKSEESNDHKEALLPPPVNFEAHFNDTCQCYENLKYGSNEEWNLLDFYPASDVDKHNVLIFCHANGGSKESIRQGILKKRILKAGIRNGYSIASLKFRHPVVDSSINAPATDISRAVQFLKAYADDLNINAENIVLVGRSRGTLALYNALMDDLQNLESTNPIHHQSSRVKGVWAVGAQTSYDFEFIVNTYFDASAGNPFGSLENYGHTLDLVTPDDPPVRLRYTDSLQVLPITNNTRSRHFAHGQLRRCVEAGLSSGWYWRKVQNKNCRASLRSV